MTDRQVNDSDQLCLSSLIHSHGLKATQVFVLFKANSILPYLLLVMLML